MALKVGDKVQLENVLQVTVSKPEQEVFEFVWNLEKFSVRVQDGAIMSPVLTSPDTKTEWKVNIRKCSANYTVYVCVGLRLATAQTDFPIKTEYTLHLLNSEMEVIKEPLNRSHSFTTNDELHEANICELSSFLDVKNRYLAADGSFNLHFRITATHYNPTSVKVEEPKLTILPMMNKETFKSLLEHGEFSDLIVKTKTSSLPTSKILLAVQSPVFKTMFLSEMLESKENVVKIEDFSDEAVKGLLEFLHTGQCESLEENAVELLKMSEKYEVVNLKRECEKSLINALNKDNAADLLILASFYNSPGLKSKVTSFVKRCRKEVAETESFKQLKKLHSEILLDLYAEFD